MEEIEQRLKRKEMSNKDFKQMMILLESSYHLFEGLLVSSADFERNKKKPAEVRHQLTIGMIIRLFRVYSSMIKLATDMLPVVLVVNEELDEAKTDELRAKLQSFNRWGDALVEAVEDMDAYFDEQLAGKMFAGFGAGTTTVPIPNAVNTTTTHPPAKQDGGE